MRNRFLVYGILISIAIHFIFLSNIKLNISNNKLLDIQLVQLPPEISKDNLSSLKNLKKEGIKKYKNNNINNRVKKKKKKIYCELCKPVKDVDELITKPVFGELIKSISMTFKVLHDLGENKGSISKIRPFGSDSEIIGNNKKNYEIDYKAKAEGISSFFYSKPLIQKSTGSIDTSGLKPDYYLYNHGKKRKSEAFFDWESKTLTINRKETSDKYVLIEQAQDQLSFMFQFMFLDPLNKMQIPITNAKVFKIYNYHYIDEANIDTKLGYLDVLHVAKFNYQSPERIDLWLAKKYGYLPVKISITEDDLSSIIQKIETLKIKKINE